MHYTWNDLVCHAAGIELGEFMVMPNHIHGIIAIVGADSKSARAPAIAQQPLSEIMRQLKTFSARRINGKRNTPGAPVWQRNYFDPHDHPHPRTGDKQKRTVGV